MTGNNTVVLDWESYDRAAAIISLTMFVLIVTLNSLVLFTLIKRDHRKSRLHFFIIHLAVADILVGILNCFGDGVSSTMGDAWYGGDVLCRIWRFLKVVSLMASNYLLIGMSIDRFLAVKCPMMFVKNGNKLPKALVLGAWLISFIISMFYLPFTEGFNGTIDKGGYCKIVLPTHWWEPYILIVMMTIYVIPTILISTSYIGICVVIWNKWKESIILSASQDTLQQEKHKKSGLLSKAKIRSIKMTFVVCIAFFTCWTPYFIFSLLDLYNMNTIDIRVYHVIGKLYPLNSVANPIIFIIFNIRMFIPKHSFYTHCFGRGNNVTYLLHDVIGGVCVTRKNGLVLSHGTML